ncbi:hypothetical protein SPBR_02028 [Sporothrix brasiliensis 5110]|uniref:Uncharacterized protein n=1 Tax=Sporothrix brasiliensis 5110 TaxID=1398154 RepID=A0A0C2FL68_9PEZI|nr:uncharacterized protein SPBR_02028 [Sporothrix brasiliensis 5110]KIH91823.1 hypothetical protein SPBR_02028 [Sporothrix brasiliensis 5110]
MNAATIRGLRAAAARHTSLTSPRLMSLAVQRQPYSSLPTVAQSSFWKQLVPKPLRRGKDGTLPVANAVSNARNAKEWNPATFYIFLFLFIGSMSIQMIALKKDFDTFMRQSDVKIGLLKDVIERIQKGEKVDVESALGTGDPAKEAEWDSVLKEIESDEVTRNFRRQEKKTAEAAPAPETSQQNTQSGPSTTKITSTANFY